MKKFLCGIFTALIVCVATLPAQAIVIDKRPTVIAVSYYEENPTVKSVLDGIKKAAKQLKAKLVFRDGRGQTDVQLAQIHDLFAQKTANCLIVIFKEEDSNNGLAGTDAVPMILLNTNSVSNNTEAAFTMGYNATEKSCNIVKSQKPSQPSFYDGY